MDSAESIAQGIHATDENTAYDASCKRLLSEKRILAWIMKSCLEEYRDCNIEEIAEKYIEGKPQVGVEAVFPDQVNPLIQGMNTEDSTVLEGTVTYDIRFEAVAPGSGEQIGLIINAEAQNRFDPGYPLLKRGIYYCSRLISSQYDRVFNRSHYEKIKKVYSIWVCLDPPEDRRNTITRYRMTEENLIGNVKETVSHYDLLSAVMVCLGGPEDKNYDGVLKLLGTLLSGEVSEARKREILENEFDIPMTRELESEVSIMCNLSQSVEEKGIQKGIQSERISTLKKLMKNKKMPIDEALETLEVPEADWPKYRELLAGQS